MASAPHALLAACAALVAHPAGAQMAEPEPAKLPTVTVVAPAPPSVEVGGFGEVPLSRTPLQASVHGAQVLQDRGVQRLADVTRLDAALGDSYNSVGYWDFLSVRGYPLDNRYNFRRDGMPINAETRIALDNKQRIEILKGISGMQAGVSAPGGLVNHVVKRPIADPLREAVVQWQAQGSLLGAIDLSQRFGEQQTLGVRLNAAYEALEPKLRAADGHRRLFALAADWRLATGTLLEAEIENSHQSQPSQPGFSLLGDRVPAPVDPRLNLNNQPWSLPVVFDGTSASMRLTKALQSEWRWSAHLATQRLRTDDRVAFPFGCGAESNFDRYCSDGSFDFYDFRSDGERRNTDALELALHGKPKTGGLQHSLSLGVLESRFRARFQGLAFNLVGIGRVDGSAVVAPDPSLTGSTANRDERSTELFVRDAVQLSEAFGLWFGLRHTSLRRDDIRQSFVSPWLAAALQIGANHMAYASWGRGVETEVAPNLTLYTNRGQALPALQSRQVEVGVKAELEHFGWTVAAFDIDRPVFDDFGACDPAAAGATCTRQIDGSARHRGVEASARWESGAWRVHGGVQRLHARRQGSQDASINDKRPVNVPALTTKLHARYAIGQWPGASIGAGAQHEGARAVLADNSLRIPSWTTVAMDGRYEQKLSGGTTLTWRAGIDNLFDRRAWRESPLQFGHVYLFPLEARTARVSLQAAW